MFLCQSVIEMLDFSSFGFLARLTPSGVDRWFASLSMTMLTDSALSHLGLC